MGFQTRMTVRSCSALLGCFYLLSAARAQGQAQPQPQPQPRLQSPPAAPAAVPNAPDQEAAIRALDATFVRGYNAGDAQALAALFTDDAEVTEADGAHYQGRELVRRAFTETFAADPGAAISIEVASIRFLTPDVAREEGRSVVTSRTGQVTPRLFTVLYVKQDGKWLMSSVREDLDPMVKPREWLKELEWMVSDWIDEGPESTARVHCDWSADGNFLLREFTLRQAGKVVLTVTQRIGWDPLAKEFHSWEFDSEGGYGEGRWGRSDNRWMIKHTGVRPEGVAASSTRVTEPIRADLIRWTQLDQVIGGTLVPGEQTSVLTRVPPAPPGDEKPAPASERTSR